MAQPILKAVTPLPELAEALLSAKAAENAARKARVQIEEQILEYFDLKDEGTTTEKLERFTISVSTGFSRKLDHKMIEEFWNKIPNAGRVLRRKYELDSKEYKYLLNNDPDSLASLHDCMTTTPKKPAVTVKAVA